MNKENGETKQVTLSDIASATDVGNLTTTVEAGWTAKDSEGNTVQIGKDQDYTLNFNGDDNISVTAENQAINVALDKDITVDSVTAGETTKIDNTGLSISGNYYVTSSGLNANSQKITNVADGDVDSDAVNFGQLKEYTSGTSKTDYQLVTNPNSEDGKYTVNDNGEVTLTVQDMNKENGETKQVILSDIASATDVGNLTTTVEAGWTATAVDNNGTVKVDKEHDYTLAFNGDNNITVTAENQAINVALNPVVTLDGNTSDGNKIVLDGNNGTINAVNSDISRTGFLEETTTKNTFDFSDGGSFVTEETTTLFDVSTGKTVHEATFNEDGATFTKTDNLVNTSSTNIDGGVITVKGEGIFGLTNNTTTIDGKEITAGDIKLNSESGNKKDSTIVGLSNTTIDYDGFADDSGRAATEKQLQEAMGDIEASSYKGWTVTTNGGENEQDRAAVASNGTVDFSNEDNNIVIGQNGTDLTFDLNDNITLGDAKGQHIQFNGSPASEENGMVSITDESGNEVFNIQQDGTLSSDGDIIADADGGKYSLSEVSQFAVRYDRNTDGTPNKNKITLGGGEAGTVITNLADGEVSSTSTDAINGSQLKEYTDKATTTVSAGDNIEVEATPNTNGSTDYKVSLQPDVTLMADGSKDNSIKLSGTGGYAQIVQGDTYTDIQGGTITVGSDIRGTDTIKLNGTAGDITGLSNTDLNDPTFATMGRAATEEQLQEASAAATTTVSEGKNIDVTATEKEDGHTNYEVSLQDNVVLGDNKITLNGNPGEGEDLLNVDNALVVGQDGTTTIAADNAETMGVDTRVTVNTDGVTFEGLENGSTIIDGQTIQAGGVFINDGGNGQITRLTNTTLDDPTFATVGRAATEEQLQLATDAATTTVTEGKNIDVTSTVDEEDGHTNYEVKLQDNVVLGDNKITLNGNPGEGEDLLNVDNALVVGQDGTTTIAADNAETMGVDTRVTVNTDGVTFEGLENGSTIIDGQTIQAGGVFINDGGNGQITRLTNTTLDDPTFATVGRAATEEQLQLATDAATTTVTEGKNIDVTSTVDEEDGHTNYEVKLQDNVVLGDNKITLNGNPGEGEDLLNVDNALVVGQDGTTTIAADNAETMGVDTRVTVNTDGVTFEGLENGSTIIDGQTIQAGGVFINDGGNGQITRLTNTTLDDPTFATVGRAATEEQLQLATDAATTTVSEGKNIDVTSTVDEEDGHTDYEVSLQDNVSLGDGKITLNGAPAEGDDLLNVDNAFVVGQDGTTTITADDAGTMGADTKVTVGTDGVKFEGLENGTTTIDGQTIQAGGVFINDGGNGQITRLTNTTLDDPTFATVGRAATEEQLQLAKDAATTTVSEGKNIDVTSTVAEDGHTDYKVSLQDEVKLGDYDNGTGIYLGGASGTISATGSISVGEDQGLVIDGNKKTINGLSNTTWDENYQITSGQAATEDQLGAVADWAESQINNSGWTASTNNGDKETAIKNGATVDFSNADGNIVVSQDVTENGTNIKFDLADKVTIGDKIELDGETGNARFTSGDEAYVDIFGATGSMKLGNGSYSISIGGSDGTITGLTNTAWNGTTDDPSRAATEGQLQQAISNVQTEFQQNDQHLVANPDSADGNYFVDGKNQINLKVQNGVDENGNPKYDTVTIDNVAQASDVGDVGKLEDAGLGVDETTGESNTVDAILDVNDKVDNLGETISSTVGKTTISNDNNVTVDTTVTTDEETGMKTTDYKIGLNNDKITLGDETNNVTIEGTKGNISATGTISAGNASMSSNGFAIGDKTYITSEGINANGQKITNVAAGTEATDAVNVGQLAEVANNSYTAINNVGNQVNRLSNRIDKVGAGAAALAALHPLDFDPDDKLSFAAGYGNYAGENAVAVGAFYQPNEDTMFSVGGTFGNDENMVNAGVSFKLGQKSNVSRSRVSMAKELVALRDEVAQLKALMAHAGILPSNGQLDTSDMFPDVPENHWAYEYIHELAKLGIVDGYPDGNFEGDRMMTRYEMAAIVYRAMQKGVNVDKRMLTEFEPELKLIRVDVVARDDNGNPTIERVRVNDEATQQA